MLAAAGLLVVASVFALFPVAVTDPTATSIAVFTLVFMVATVAWNVFSGYSGYLALGHAVFFGCGGYAVALAARDWHFKGGWDVFGLLPFAGLVAAAIAIPVGLVALRTRRHTFVVVTIAIFFIFQLAAFNLSFTGGTSGIELPIAPFTAANYNQPFYYVALAILVLTVAMSWAVRRSRFGLQLLAIRDDEDRARGLGVKTTRVKLVAFVLSAVPVGMVGGLYFYFLGQIFPQFAFDPLFDISLALMAFLGGIGTLRGAAARRAGARVPTAVPDADLLRDGHVPDRLRGLVPRRDPAAPARRRPDDRPVPGQPAGAGISTRAPRASRRSATAWPRAVR